MGLVAGKAGTVLCLIDRHPVDESTEAPPPGGCISFRVLHHDLNGRCGPGNKCRRILARPNAFERELHQNRAVGERQGTVAIRSHRRRVADYGAQFVEATGLLGWSDERPGTIALRERNAVDRRHPLTNRRSVKRRRAGYRTAQSCEEKPAKREREHRSHVRATSTIPIGAGERRSRRRLRIIK